VGLVFLIDRPAYRLGSGRKVPEHGDAAVIEQSTARRYRSMSRASVVFFSSHDDRTLGFAAATWAAIMLRPGSRSERRMDELTERLRRFIRARVASRQDAEDVIQEAYLRVLRYSAENVVENRERLLFSAARNLAIDSGRRLKAREKNAADWAVLTVADWPASDEVVDARQRLTYVAEAITTLPPRCREVFLMHRIDGLSYSQIARKLCITVSAVEKHIARACLLIDATINGEPHRR
jgi:RNA polymerase sigma factor (sigma-70 family)